MSDLLTDLPPEMERAFYRLYRDFFDKAERKRRWNIRDDIPWNECNPNLDPAIADVVETFCGVELYLPDYVGKILPAVRKSRGRAWFYANWGYEESKHSLALSDWLVHSGRRSEEYMADFEGRVFDAEWNLPHGTPLGMLTYAMVQEYATWLNYRNLKQRCTERGGDPALERVLTLLQVDEAAHHSFFRDCFELYLKFDRSIALEALRAVLNNFQMPAVADLLEHGPRRFQQVKDLHIFDNGIFVRDVYLKLIRDLGIDKSEMRMKAPPKSLPN